MYVPEFLQNRTYLLTIIGIVTTFAVLGPFFIGQTLLTAVLGTHAILHIAAITFGVFLTIVSIIAYSSTKNTNMIFTAFAFLTFTVLSVFLLQEDYVADLVEHEESVAVDILLTVMIGLFAIGVFSNQKFPTRTKYN